MFGARVNSEVATMPVVAGGAVVVMVTIVLVCEYPAWQEQSKTVMGVRYTSLPCIVHNEFGPHWYSHSSAAKQTKVIKKLATMMSANHSAKLTQAAQISSIKLTPTDLAVSRDKPAPAMYFDYACVDFKRQ